MINQSDFILIAIYHLTEGKIKQVDFEEVVVKAFELFPEVFQLKGYPQYPDSDQINKRIYDKLKPQGLVRVANKKLELTEFGQEKAKLLIERSHGYYESEKHNALTKRERKLWQRLLNLDGFKIFLENPNKKPLDIDLYDFYGISVRTSKSEVQGKIRTITDLILKANRLSMPGVKEILEYKKRLDDLFEEIKLNEN